MMPGIGRDLRLAVRQLVRAPGFAALARRAARTDPIIALRSE